MVKNTEYRIFQIFLVLILFSQVSSVAAVEAPAEQWNRSFGGDGEDSSWCVQQTSDGGYIVAGITASYSKGIDGYPDAWLIKADNIGNIQWNRTYGGTSFDEGYFTRQTSDGGYVLSGYTFPSGYGEPWLIKTNKNGNEMWDKISDNITHEDYLQYRAERTSDGGYIIGDVVVYEIGSYQDLVLTDTDIRLTKYDINGDQQWNNSFGKNHSLETLSSMLNPVKQTSDSGYVIASTTKSNDSNSYDIWLIKTDEYGQEQWNKTFGESMNDSAISISLTSDNGYVLTGMYNDSWSFGINGSAFILKTDSEGNQEWVKEFKNCTLYSVQPTSDGGYIAAGVKNGNAWLVKLASDKEGTQYEDGKNNESENGNGTESESGESVEYENTSDSFFDQIRYYIYDTFNGFFQWDYYT